MKIAESNIQTVVVGEKKSKQFGISDNKVIFDILRNRLYVNPIAAICREISSNCRDANREAGNEHIPIEISIEKDFTNLGIAGDAAISFKDNGPGIDPDRMDNVFLLYGESTKRETDYFTGGYGLGAKTPFAYSDTFSIKTVCDFNGKRMKYFYVAAIDKEEKGTMYLFKEEETLDEKGTTITIPLKERDQLAFELQLMDMLKGWSPQPLFKNFSSYDKDKLSVKKIQMDKFEIWLSEKYISNKEIIAAIDEIPYQLPFGNLGGSTSVGVIVMPFKNGELSLNGSRESIRSERENTQKINAKLKHIRAVAAKWIDDYVSSAPNEIRKRFMYWGLHNIGIKSANFSDWDENKKITFTFNSLLNNCYKNGEKEQLFLQTCVFKMHNIQYFSSQKRKTFFVESTVDIFHLLNANKVGPETEEKIKVYLIDTKDKILFRINTVLLSENKIIMLEDNSFYDALNKENHRARTKLIKREVFVADPHKDYHFSERTVNDLRLKKELNEEAYNEAEKEFNKRKKADLEAIKEFCEIKKLSEVAITRYSMDKKSTNKKETIHLSFRRYSLDPERRRVSYNDIYEKFETGKKNQFSNYIIFKAKSISEKSTGISTDAIKFVLASVFSTEYSVVAASVNYKTMVKMGAIPFEKFVDNITTNDLIRIKRFMSWKHIDTNVFEIFLNQKILKLDETDLKKLNHLKNTPLTQHNYEKGFIDIVISTLKDRYIDHHFITSNENLKDKFKALLKKIDDEKLPSEDADVSCVLDRYPMLKIINVRKIVGDNQKLDIINNYITDIQNGK